MAGTFGAVVKDAAGQLLILSNNHVLSDEGQLVLGSPICQPGTLDGGIPATDQIASLTRFVPYSFTSPNHVDCALAAIISDDLVTPDIPNIGHPSGIKQAAPDMVVERYGRTSSFSVGHVKSIEADVTVKYDTGNYVFKGQIMIESLDDSGFGDVGDSGSLILERGTGHAIGLLFSGSSSHAFANHIGDVLQALNVQLA
jgi:hypothetical protein